MLPRTRRRLLLILGLASLVAICGAIAWQRLTVRAEHRRADAERRAMQGRLGISSEPIQFVGNRLQERLKAGERIPREEVEEFIRGFSERLDQGEKTTYLYFIVKTPLLGTGAGWIEATYSDDGVLAALSRDAGDPLWGGQRGTPVEAPVSEE